ncbi:MAG: class I SAM-dependent methyltransferase [Bradymonadaceae bacterium]
MSDQNHWQRVYEEKSADAVSWYQERPALSLELIKKVWSGPGMKLVDIGGGASTLVDHLLEEGGFEVTVVDLAEAALETSRRRLGERAEDVQWLAADLTKPLPLNDVFDIWHDRAVFHFMVEAADRQAYLANLRRHLRPGGVAILATFGSDGPERCSGLAVRRYEPDELAMVLGDDFELIETRSEVHQTPWGSGQSFRYVVFMARPRAEE